jgi:hypothetical protein
LNAPQLRLELLLLFLQVREFGIRLARLLFRLGQTRLELRDGVDFFAVFPVHLDEVGGHGISLPDPFAHELDPVLKAVELLEGVHRRAVSAEANKRGIPMAGHP